MQADAHRSPRWRSALGQAPAVIGGLAIMVAVLALPDLGPPATPQASTVTVHHARILSIHEADPATGGRTATVMVLDGPGAGTTITADLESVGAPRFTTPYEVGEDVIVEVSENPDGAFAAVTDRWRLPMLLALVGIFFLLVVLVGGWRGIRAVIALALTFAVALKVLLPLLMAGWDPVGLAVGCAAAITLLTFLLTEGLQRSTAAAALGTFAALALTAVTAAVATELARFTQLQGNEDVGYLRTLLGSDFDLSGLLLAAIILGALGVLDDVTITQAATVNELARADPGASRRTLIGRAMNVGRSHIAATVNTLVLAYVAAAMPLLLIFAAGRQPAATLASTEVVAVEIVRAMVGSIGIVAAVPLTTLFAVLLVRHEAPATRWRTEAELWPRPIRDNGEGPEA